MIKLLECLTHKVNSCIVITICKFLLVRLHLKMVVETCDPATNYARDAFSDAILFRTSSNTVTVPYLFVLAVLIILKTNSEIRLL